MLFEYCCTTMREAMNDGLIGLDDEGVCDIEGWKLDFCPFCGERIIVRVACKGNGAEGVDLGDAPMNDLAEVYGQNTEWRCPTPSDVPRSPTASFSSEVQ